MSDKIIDINTLQYYHDKITSNYGKGVFVIKDYILNNYKDITDISDNPYNYYHDIIDERITENDFANVSFDVNDALSGIFSPTCETFNGHLRIYSKSNLITTIPSILIYRL